MNEMLLKFLLKFFTSVSWDASFAKRWKSLLARVSVSWFGFDFLCVTPLWLGEIKAKKSTPSFE
jgi:hypothetical protein